MYHFLALFSRLLFTLYPFYCSYTFSIVIAFLGQMIGSVALSRRTANLDRRKTNVETREEKRKKKQVYFIEWSRIVWIGFVRFSDVFVFIYLPLSQNVEMRRTDIALSCLLRRRARVHLQDLIKNAIISNAMNEENMRTRLCSTLGILSVLLLFWPRPEQTPS